MNTTRYRRHYRSQRWLSPRRVQQKFAELRALLRGTADQILVQGELALAMDQADERRHEGY